MFENKPPKATRKIAPNLSEGKKVVHAKFGVGIIKRKLGREVFRVTFENHGTKDVHYDYLSLI